MKKWLVMGILGIFIFMAAGCSDAFEEEAVAKAEVDNPEKTLAGVRVPVTKDFMPNMNFVPRSNMITHVVLHFISNAAENPENPFVYEEIRNIFIDYDVSPHYMIDRDGGIYFILPESRRARHAGKGELLDFPDYKDGLNDHSIGIELMAIGTEAEMKSIMSPNDYQKIPKELIGYTEAQYKSLNLLLDDILERNKKIKRDRIHIIGHDEYAPDRKSDPGVLFDWNKILLNGE